MISTELDAAGVREPSLRAAYQHCRTVNAQHGKTFFLATRLLAPRQRPAVHALYPAIIVYQSAQRLRPTDRVEEARRCC